VRYRTDHPGMSAEATRWLIDRSVRMMGCDAITFDPAVWAMFERKLAPVRAVATVEEAEP
jgi:kynurenine formamidase